MGLIRKVYWSQLAAPLRRKIRVFNELPLISKITGFPASGHQRGRVRACFPCGYQIIPLQPPVWVQRVMTDELLITLLNSPTCLVVILRSGAGIWPAGAGWGEGGGRGENSCPEEWGGRRLQFRSGEIGAGGWAGGGVGLGE